MPFLHDHPQNRRQWLQSRGFTVRKDIFAAHHGIGG
jgi:hypothetical protein